MIRKMGKECSLGNPEMFIKEIINLMKEMDMVKCFLQMAQFIEAIGKEVFNAGKVQ